MALFSFGVIIETVSSWIYFVFSASLTMPISDVGCGHAAGCRSGDRSARAQG
jgi:hypothetical protein